MSVRATRADNRFFINHNREERNGGTMETAYAGEEKEEGEMGPVEGSQ
jgi:hypothetical protein